MGATRERTGGSMTRRSFLQFAGAAASALVLPQTLFASRDDGKISGNPGGLSFKIGVLLPCSNICPDMADNYMAGMTLCLDRTGNGSSGGRISLIREDVGQGIPVSAFRKLVRDDGVHLVAGVMNAEVAATLDGYLRDEAAPLVVSNVGEYMVRQGCLNRPILHCTLNYWQANWAMGEWASRHLGRKAFVVASLYDSGYDAADAFRLGFSYGGGRVVQTSVCHEKDTGSLLREIEVAGPDFVYALYCGPQAVEFVRAYSSSGLAGKTPLAGSAFLVDGQVLCELGPSAAGIKACLPWRINPLSPQGAGFGADFRTKTGRAPDIFALLGYETAGLIVSALDSTGSFGSINVMRQAFRDARFAGPRGTVGIDRRTCATTGPLYVHELQIVNGKAVTTAIAGAPALSETDAQVRALRTARASSWHNPYLCV